MVPTRSLYNRQRVGLAEWSWRVAQDNVRKRVGSNPTLYTPALHYTHKPQGFDKSAGGRSFIVVSMLSCGRSASRLVALQKVCRVHTHGSKLALPPSRTLFPPSYHYPYAPSNPLFTLHFCTYSLLAPWPLAGHGFRATRPATAAAAAWLGRLWGAIPLLLLLYEPTLPRSLPGHSNPPFITIPVIMTMAGIL